MKLLHKLQAKISQKCLVLLFLAIGFISYSQTVDVTKVIPPSPTASALGKYGSVPVGFYSGTPSISVPIYNLTVGNYSLPISLSYFAGGVRVEDIASWVGLGWSLNAGGVISISVKDRSDFDNKYVRFTPAQIQNDLTQDRNQMYDVDYYGDSEPDVFSYNFCGYQGQFVLDKDLKAQFLKNDGQLTISCYPTYISADLVSLKIVATDNKGRIYTFEADEFSNSYTQQASASNKVIGSCGTAQFSKDDDAITAVYLTKIELESGRSINFVYGNEEQKYSTKYSTTVRSEWINSQLTWDYYNFDIIEPVLASRKANIHQTKVLKQISTSEGNVLVFNSSTARLDLYGSNRLDDITVYYGAVNSSRQRKFVLMYDYFSSAISKNDEYNKSLDKRLKLIGVKEFGLTDSDLKNPYLFHYFGDDGTTYKLPYRTCFSGDDSWGFCNKAVTDVNIANDYLKMFSNENVVQDCNLCQNKLVYPESQSCNNLGQLPPTPSSLSIKSDMLPCSREIHSTYSSFGAFTQGESKLPDLTYSKIGTLDCITYPTKGRTTFDYELNSFRYDFYVPPTSATYSSFRRLYSDQPEVCGGLRVKEIKDIVDLAAITRRFTYEDGVLVSRPSNVRAVSGIPSSKNNNNENKGCVNFSWWEKSPDSVDPSYTSGGSVGYSVVKEVTDNGSIEYRYLTPKDFSFVKSTTIGYFQMWDFYGSHIATNNFRFWGGGTFSRPIYPFFQGSLPYNYAFGELKQTTVYNTQNQIVRDELNDYTFIPATPIYGNQIFALGESGLYYKVTAYSYERGIAYLTSKTISEFNDTSTPIITTNMMYYNTDFGLLTSQCAINGSDRDSSRYIYPIDLSYFDSYTRTLTPVVDLMLSRKMLNYPIEVVKYKNGAVVGANYTEYQQIGSLVLPNKSFSLSTNAPMNSFITSEDYLKKIYKCNYNSFAKDGGYTLEASILFGNTGNFGNPVDVKDLSGVDKCFLWNIGITLPLARAENTSYDKISYTSFEGTTVTEPNGNNEWITGYGNQVLDSYSGKYSFQPLGSVITSSKTFPAGTYVVSLASKFSATGGGAVTTGFGEPFWPGTGVWNYAERTITLTTPQKITFGAGTIGNILIDEIRVRPLGSQMTTYTYSSFSAITTQTDANGLVTKFEYDGFGRLVRIKDNDGKVLKEMEYNYSH